MWDQDFIDMETEGYFSFETEEFGYFQFGLVQGRIDYRIEKIGDIERLEFTWEGQDENDPALGSGWLRFRDENHLEGRLKLHLGDSSKLQAKRAN